MALDGGKCEFVRLVRCFGVGGNPQRVSGIKNRFLISKIVQESKEMNQILLNMEIWVCDLKIGV